MSLQTKQALRVIYEFKNEHGVEKFDLEEITNWAINNNKLPLPRPAIARYCRDLLSRALREERVTDPQGRRVRKFHAVRIDKHGHTSWLWGDKDIVDSGHMKTSFQQRRKEISNDCCSLNLDVKSYNDNNNKGANFQIEFNFNNDVKESELAETNPTLSPTLPKRPSSQSRAASSDSTSSRGRVRP